jgi:glucans biosynthesis protein
VLDGPSLTGAYRFLMQRTKGVVMEIENTLFLRQPVDRLGLAPLTTMYMVFRDGEAGGRRMAT